MKYGFVNNQFYVDFTSPTREVGNMRQESDRRALEIAEMSKNIVVGFSGGLDSQCMLHSFFQHDIPVETVFLYLPSYNDNEYKQVQECDKKYQIKTQIIDLDVMAIKDELCQLSVALDIPNLNAILQRKFLSLLPDHVDFVQNAHDPMVYVNPNSNNKYYTQSYQSAEFGRDRAFKSLNRLGRHIFWGWEDEYLFSVLNDDIFKGAIASAKYFDENNAKVEGKKLNLADRWDYYIKPIIYGRYWGDELIYFPKFSGFETIDFIQNMENLRFKQHAIAVPYYELLEFFSTTKGETKRVMQNVDPKWEPKDFASTDDGNK